MLYVVDAFDALRGSSFQLYLHKKGILFLLSWVIAFIFRPLPTHTTVTPAFTSKLNFRVIVLPLCCLSSDLVPKIILSFDMLRKLRHSETTSQRALFNVILCSLLSLPSKPILASQFHCFV